MKDAKGHGSDSKGDPAPAPTLAAHQTGVSKIGKVAKIGAYIYAAQAAAGVAGGIGWALWHSFGGG